MPTTKRGKRQSVIAVEFQYSPEVNPRITRQLAGVLNAGQQSQSAGRLQMTVDMVGLERKPGFGQILGLAESLETGPSLFKKQGIDQKRLSREGIAVRRLERRSFEGGRLKVAMTIEISCLFEVRCRDGPVREQHDKKKEAVERAANSLGHH